MNKDVLDQNEGVPETPELPSGGPAGKPEDKPAPEAAAARPARPKPSLFTRILRRLLIALILVGLGAVAVLIWIYQPMQDRLNAGQASLQNELQAAQEQIATLESRVSSQDGLEERNQALQAELDDAQMHIALLKAQADVARAQLALAEEDEEGARLALAGTADTLEQISLLAPNQQEVIDGMLQRLELAQQGVGQDQFAARSDLDVLAANLLQLESSLFANP